MAKAKRKSTGSNTKPKVGNKVSVETKPSVVVPTQPVAPVVAEVIVPTPVVETPVVVKTAPVAEPVVKTVKPPKVQGSVAATPIMVLRSLLHKRSVLFSAKGGAINNKHELEANMLQIYLLAHEGDEAVLSAVIDYLQTKRYEVTDVGTHVMTAGFSTPKVQSVVTMIAMLRRIVDKRRLNGAAITPNEQLLDTILNAKVRNYILQNLN